MMEKELKEIKEGLCDSLVLMSKGNTIIIEYDTKEATDRACDILEKYVIPTADDVKTDNTLPHAIRGNVETLFLAMGVIVSTPFWYNLPEDQLVSKAMRATGGSVNPENVRNEISKLMAERGLSK